MTVARVRSPAPLRRVAAIASRRVDRARAERAQTLIERIRNSVIGDGTVLDGPFGQRPTARRRSR